MYSALRLAHSFFRRTLNSYKKPDPNKPNWHLAGQCLIENSSYRLPQSAQKDPLIGCKVLVRVLKAIWFQKENIKSFSTGGTAILDGSFKFISFEPEYVERQSQDKVNHFISKTDLVFSYGLIDAVFATLLIVYYSRTWLIQSLVSSHRTNYALLITELIESANLIRLIKKHNIAKIYDFIPFEKDSNLLTILLRHLKVESIKLPLLVP